MALCLVVILIHIFILVLFLRLSFYSSLCFTLFSSFTNCFWASPRLVLVLVSFLVLHFVKIFLLLLVFNLVLVLQNVFVIVLFFVFIIVLVFLLPLRGGIRIKCDSFRIQVYMRD